MIRLDKFLVHTNTCSRSEARNLARSGRILINGSVVKSSDVKIDETKDTVTLDGKPLLYEEFSYYILNKPAGIVTACEDSREKTVMDFFKDEPCKDLFPVGRLDKDTVGLLLITNDGALAHSLLSPSKHVWKKYFVRLEKPLGTEEAAKIESGVDIGDENPTLPAKLEFTGSDSSDGSENNASDTVLLSIMEGRFHQVKRMFEAVGNKVVYLKRVEFGNLKLNPSLKEGEYKKISKEEIINGQE